MQIPRTLLDGVHMLLTARHTGDTGQEQSACYRLRAQCETRGLDMGEVVDAGADQLRADNLAIFG